MAGANKRPLPQPLELIKKSQPVPLTEHTHNHKIITTKNKTQTHKHQIVVVVIIKINISNMVVKMKWQNPPSIVIWEGKRVFRVSTRRSILPSEQDNICLERGKRGGRGRCDRKYLLASHTNKSTLFSVATSPPSPLPPLSSNNLPRNYSPNRLIIWWWQHCVWGGRVIFKEWRLGIHICFFCVLWWCVRIWKKISFFLSSYREGASRFNLLGS